MDIVHAIILGIVEGVTEFLPISSTFHLIFASKLLGIPQDEFAKLFEVFIQSGAIVAVLLLYFKELIKDQELIKKTIVGFIPTAIIGLGLYKVIKGIFFESELLMLSVFIIVGFVFILFEKWIKQGKIELVRSIKSLTYQEAIIIGLIQALAIVPGVSRAGAVILGMMFLKYKRDEAAKFSFILAIPTIFAASALDLWKGKEYLISHASSTIYLLIGFITAFISAYIVIKWLINYLKKNSFEGFGVYRIIVGILLLSLFFLSVS